MWYYFREKLQKMTTTSDGYLNVYGRFCSHDNYDEVFQATFSGLSRELNLTSVKSCLIFGPGEGKHEVPFIKQCAANVSKLIAVEPDHQSAEILSARLSKDLPDVDCQVTETDIQSWKGMDGQVDLVIMMHVLYYVNPSERKELFRKLKEQWLTRGGLAIVVSSSRTKCPGNANEIYARLGTPMPAWEDIEADILAAGLVKQHAHEKQYMRDFTNPDESFLRFYQKHIEQPVTLDDVRNAINELFPNGKSDQVFYTFAVFQRE